MCFAWTDVKKNRARGGANVVLHMQTKARPREQRSLHVGVHVTGIDVAHASDPRSLVGVICLRRRMFPICPVPVRVLSLCPPISRPN